MTMFSHFAQCLLMQSHASLINYYKNVVNHNSIYYALTIIYHNNINDDTSIYHNGIYMILYL